MDTETHMHNGRRGETQEDHCFQANQERGLEQTLPSQPSEETSPADTLILDF